jgi:uncharacterized protein YecE (DUF72 family)
MASVENERLQVNRAHIGTMGWSYSFWKGNFYPDGVKSKQFLAEYSKHFNSVEIDNTFYRIPSEKSILEWADQTPITFLFSVKFPSIITHVKMLRNCEDDVNRFIQRISKLENKLGPLLMQFPPNFNADRLPLLADFLPSLPKEFRYALEVRNKSLLDEQLRSLLREYGVALTMVDSASVRTAEAVTADFAYVRWEGDRRKVTGTRGKVEVDRRDSIRMWGDRVRGFLSEGVEVFGYFSKYYSGHPPTDARQLLDLL